MASTPSSSSTLSISSTKLPFQPQNHPLRRGLLFPTTIGGRRRCLKLKFSAVRAAAGSGASGGSSRSRRVVYRESQAQNPSPIVQFKEIASAIVPPVLFVAVSVVLWKVVGKILLPKPKKASTTENKPASSEMKWSFAAGTNLLKNMSQKIERDSKLKLNDFAKELRSFNVVDMSGRSFGDEGLFFLAESLAYNQVAEEVDFSANGITSAGVKAFDGILQSNVYLKTLNLSGNTIGDEGAKCLCEVLANNSGIEKLQLNSTGLEDEGAKAIAEMLKKNTTLRILELNNNMIDYSGFASIAEALLENNTIQSLHLTGNYGGALGVAALAKGIEANKSLRDLHLHGNSMGNEGVRTLMSALSTRKGKVIQLDISNNEIGSRGAFHIAEYVKSSKSLLWLNVYMNDIGDEGAEKIADALKLNRSITTIDLGGNNIHAKGISCIAEVLKDNEIISTLEIGYNPIGPDGAKALADVLKFHGKVKTLKLGWCQIGRKGAEFISEMIKYNTTISTLDLRANGLMDEGVVCLAKSLKVVNEALTSLDLGFNEIRDSGAYAIAQALKSNEDIALTSINLTSNFITKLGQVMEGIIEKWPAKLIGPMVPSFYLDGRIERDIGYGASLWKPLSEKCKDWLQNKAPKSVIYISFGSMVSLTQEQTEEIAWALKESNYNFLWVVRDSQASKLPKEFLEEVELTQKGMIVTWCNQLEVLAHEATACFVTHCGWNSTLEGLTLGIPMVGVPQWSDQLPDAKFIEEVWGVGVWAKEDEKGVVRKEHLVECLKEVMEGEKSKEIRENALKWKDLSKKAVSEGGSSDKHVEDFVQHLKCTSFATFKPNGSLITLDD